MAKTDKTDWIWIIVGFAIVATIGGGLAAVSTIVPSGIPDIVRRFGDAIANAEGFFLAGSRAQRNNNPGDIESGGQFIVYRSITEGWQALYDQVHKMFYGGSLYYNPAMTIRQVAYIYADGEHDPTGAANWAQNVANYFGVSPDTTLNTLMGT